MTTGSAAGAAPLIGLGFRLPIADWIVDNLDRIDVVEITVDHYLLGSDYHRARIRELAGQVPVTAHGIGLSIGTDVPLDERYLEQVAEAIRDIGAPSYSEHLAFTKVPGIDLANLLPLPRTEAVTAGVIEKVRRVRAIVGVPFHLENISAIFDYPDSVLSEAEFLALICREGGAGILLDVENVHANAFNHGFDPRSFLDSLPEGSVTGVHTAGGHLVEEDYLSAPVWADAHNHPVPEETLDLLDHALARQNPETIILERDDRLDRTDEVARDIDRLRARYGGAFRTERRADAPAL